MAAALVFVAITLTYCAPVFQGKTLRQGDTNQWKGMSHQLVEYNKTADEPSAWADAMFSGMPSYQISLSSPNHGVVAVINAVDRFFRNLVTLFFDSVLGLLMGYFIGFFIMMRCFGVNRWMSIVGAIAVAMSSYFFLIIPAGHETKALTLGMMAPVIGGFFLIFRKKYLPGAVLVMLYSSIGMMRHPQMSYYIFMMLGIFGIAEIFIHIKEKRLKDLGIAVAIFAAAIGVGVGTGYHSLKANNEYVAETMRGGHSELSGEGKSSSGLSLEYATAWSYGIDETLTLLIPNYMGGASNYNVGTGSKAYSRLQKAGMSAAGARQIVQGMPTYWGDQPFTAGPVYVGAIVCFLFLLGCIVVKGPYKWALIAATVFSVLLSWGHNFMPLTELFYNYFPMYNKFRTVSSILIVAQITMPLLGFLAVRDIMDGRVDRKAAVKAIYTSAGILGGICLFFAALGPAVCSLYGAADEGLPEWFLPILIEQRAGMLRADSFRSLVFILASAGVLWFYVQDKLKWAPMVAAMGVLVLADMWPVDRRFFGADNWVAQKQNNDFFKMQPYEAQILQDPGYFRVANLAGNTFNDARTSYYLNSIGGYHAAKLRRYQDLIDQHLSKGNWEVYNMLNTKYIIQNSEEGPYPLVNPDAYGNAWFVDDVLFVGGPKEESEALNVLDLSREAVSDASFQSYSLGNTEAVSGRIELTAHTPDRLEYVAECDGEKTAVFSEIYYPHGWNAYIDGKPVEHFRVNYVLRALNIPAGEHLVEFEFRPASIYQGYKLSAAFKALMYLLIIAAAAVAVRKSRV